jgi:wyosine [tRNA(Phe)-imidazoG37] synthetase (radical SAM superfamily)
MHYKYLFGPVPSRRLGLSLGIDITPEEECSFNCTYCECGRTRTLTTERREYVPTADVIAELRGYLASNPPLDSITFSGSGEPTLHSGIGEIISFLKTEYPQYTVTVITNSTLLHLPAVRKALLRADRVMPSLDAARRDSFLLINRPSRGISLPDMIQGLRDFCGEYKGEVWLEIFIIPGINDSREELDALRDVIKDLRVDRVQLNTLDRPGTEDVPAAPIQHLEEIAHYLGPPAEVIASRRPGHSAANLPPETGDLILHALSLRTLTLHDLAAGLELSAVDCARHLDELIHTGRVEVDRTGDNIMYRAKVR